MIRPAKTRPPGDQPHPGISMHRIRAFYGGVGDGPAAFLAAVGAVIICLVKLPEAMGFLIASLCLGLVAVVVMRAWYRHRTVELKRLSILGKP